MSSVLFIALIFYPIHASTVQTSKCQHICEQCVSADECKSILVLLENVCKISGSIHPNCVFDRSNPGDSCKAKESMRCNKTTHFLVEQFPDFKDCICVKENCSIKQLIGKQCFGNKGKLYLVSTTNSPLTALQQTKSKETAHPGRFENNCMIANDLCNQNTACSVTYKHFQRVCQAVTAECSHRKVGQQCFIAWKELRKTVLGNCTCPEPMHKTCTEIWTNIFNNTCLQRTLGYQSSPMNRAHSNEVTHAINADQLKIKSQWKLSSLSSYVRMQESWCSQAGSASSYSCHLHYSSVYRNLQSCFQVNMDCVNDEVCNRQLSSYFQMCRVNGTHCNVNRCQAALRFFYENMPSNVAQMLTFCDCLPSDENCHQAKALLHGEPCAVSRTPVLSCLSVMHMCKRNSFCRGKLGAFTSQCLNDRTQECLEDNVCPESLSMRGLVCANSTECRAAYVGLWGTVLHTECICGLSSPAEESACKVFHHIFHNKSCFSQISGEKVDLSPSHLVLSALPATGMQPVFYGDTIYITVCIICIVLFLGIILLTLVKTRDGCATDHQAKTALPAHLSERLVILQQPWLINCADNALSDSSH